MDGQRRQPDRGAPTDPHALPDNLRRRRTWNPAAWTPARSSFTPNRRPSAPSDRRFAPTEHLAPEAVAAYVDGELTMPAHMRATHHLALCHECVAAVDAQLAARTRLRSSCTMPIPNGLLGQLSQIPTREFDVSDHVGRSISAQSMAPRRRPDAVPDSVSADHESTRGLMHRWRSR